MSVDVAYLGEPGIASLQTEVSQNWEDGIANYLIRYILSYAEEHSLKIKPICPLVKAFIDKHSEYQANSMYYHSKPI
ncbi:N-acetyltransferase [Acinetobacter haemolyticus]|uniref:N-acetyltransferase n=1 Tax=Acinetobacter haemolyticus TaxID=29430 RepID=UPI003AF5D041